jgi:hypothetical protein
MMEPYVALYPQEMDGTRIAGNVGEPYDFDTICQSNAPNRVDLRVFLPCLLPFPQYRTNRFNHLQ